MNHFVRARQFIKKRWASEISRDVLTIIQFHLARWGVALFNSFSLSLCSRRGRIQLSATPSAASHQLNYQRRCRRTHLVDSTYLVQCSRAVHSTTFDPFLYWWCVQKIYNILYGLRANFLTCKNVSVNVWLAHLFHLLESTSFLIVTPRLGRFRPFHSSILRLLRIKFRLLFYGFEKN